MFFVPVWQQLFCWQSETSCTFCRLPANAYRIAQFQNFPNGTHSFKSLLTALLQITKSHRHLRLQATPAFLSGHLF